MTDAPGLRVGPRLAESRGTLVTKGEPDGEPLRGSCWISQPSVLSSKEETQRAER